MWEIVNLTLNPTLWERVNLTLNPTLWGIFRKIFRILHCEEFWNEKKADNSLQAWLKFLTMLDFYLDESNIVRNFSKYFQILHCEEFWNEKWNSSHCRIFTWKNFFLLHLQLFLIVGVGVKKSSIIVRNFITEYKFCCIVRKS